MRVNTSVAGQGSLHKTVGEREGCPYLGVAGMCPSPFLHSRLLRTRLPAAPALVASDTLPIDGLCLVQGLPLPDLFRFLMSSFLPHFLPPSTIILFAVPSAATARCCGRTQGFGAGCCSAG